MPILENMVNMPAIVIDRANSPSSIFVINLLKIKNNKSPPILSTDDANIPSK